MKTAINDGQLVDMPMTVKVDWNLGDDESDKSAPANTKDTRGGGEK
jgi:hypothetical protein